LASVRIGSGAPDCAMAQKDGVAVSAMERKNVKTLRMPGNLSPGGGTSN
jgi:hypothetical protein